MTQLARCIAVCLFVILLSALTVTGNPSNDWERELSRAVSLYWEALDLQSQARDSQQEARFNELSTLLEEINNRLGKSLMDAIDSGDQATLEAASLAFRSIPMESRAAIKGAADQAKITFLQVPLPPGTENYEDYFPGYGYGEPGYVYRRGRETARESKGEFWQLEEYSITKNKQHTFQVTFSLLSTLQKLLELGVIKNLSIGKPTPFQMNGTSGTGYQVTFTSAQTMASRANRKYEIFQVWFELSRAKKVGFGIPPTQWEPCGTTFQTMYEPTGGLLVSQIGTPTSPLQPLPTQPYPAQPYPAQPYPAQPYPAQPYPAQPYPAQPYPTQPYPAYPYPGQLNPGYPYPTGPQPDMPIPGTF